MTDQRVLSFADVCRFDARTTAVWVTDSIRSRAAHALVAPILPSLQPLPEAVKTLVVIGGGTLLDEAKVWWQEHASTLELVAIPSLWGSGAEVSPIAVRNRSGVKDIRLSPALRPTYRAYWPELVTTLPEDLVRYACGDTWAHALEGFLSPLAADELRQELAVLIQRLLTTPMAPDPVWFALSAEACAGQARSSVGLVHGLAHTLEGVLAEAQPHSGWSHARLCALFLWPVMCFNRQGAAKFTELMTRHYLSQASILQCAQSLHVPSDYAALVPYIEQNWMRILRDPCSRTNCTLVRPSSLEYFVKQVFV